MSSPPAGTPKRRCEIAAILRQAKGRIALLAAAAGRLISGHRRLIGTLCRIRRCRARGRPRIPAAQGRRQRRVRPRHTATIGLVYRSAMWRPRAQLFLRYRHRRLLRAQRRDASTSARATKIFTRIVQRPRRGLMQDRIGDDYVFRTDLRLRPDPGATPVALRSTPRSPTTRAAARTGSARAWIKARPCAGDMRDRRRRSSPISPPTSGAATSISPPSPTSRR